MGVLKQVDANFIIDVSYVRLIGEAGIQGSIEHGQSCYQEEIHATTMGSSLTFASHGSQRHLSHRVRESRNQVLLDQILQLAGPRQFISCLPHMHNFLKRLELSVGSQAARPICESIFYSCSIARSVLGN